MPKAKAESRTPRASSADLSDDVDASAFVPVIGRGIHADEYQGSPPVQVKYVVADDQSLSFSLSDGRRVAVPIAWYPRLVHARPAERNDWRLIIGGRAVLWESLGIAISAKALLEGTKANESASSLKKWLEARSGGRKRKAS